MLEGPKFGKYGALLNVNLTADQILPDTCDRCLEVPPRSIFLLLDGLEVSSCFLTAGGGIGEEHFILPSQLDTTDRARRDILTLFITHKICLLWRLAPVC